MTGLRDAPTDRRAACLAFVTLLRGRVAVGPPPKRMTGPTLGRGCPEFEGRCFVNHTSNDIAPLLDLTWCLARRY
jgi:hypothetical protein